MTRLLARAWDLGLSLCACKTEAQLFDICVTTDATAERVKGAVRKGHNQGDSNGRQDSVTYESGERFTRAKTCSRGEQRQVSDSHISEANCKLLQEMRDKS